VAFPGPGTSDVEVRRIVGTCLDGTAFPGIMPVKQLSTVDVDIFGCEEPGCPAVPLLRFVLRFQRDVDGVPRTSS
jgi:hypothetical protein